MTNKSILFPTHGMRSSAPYICIYKRGRESTYHSLPLASFAFDHSLPHQQYYPTDSHSFRFVSFRFISKQTAVNILPGVYTSVMQLNVGLTHSHSFQPKCVCVCGVDAWALPSTFASRRKGKRNGHNHSESELQHSPWGSHSFPPLLQTSYRHLGLASRRHEVELFNVVTKVSAVTEQQRSRKYNGSVARLMLPIKSLPFQRNDVVVTN